MNPFSVLTSKIFGGVAFAALIAAGVQSCRLDRAIDQRDEARQLASAERAAHHQTIANYRAAAFEFAREAAANVARVKAERDSITERKLHELQIARASADARYRRLLESAAEADSRGAGDVDLSGVADATCRAYAGTGCHELPARLKAAQDNTDQLLALQAWALEQSRVATSPAPAD
jgi:hypothetical protein